ncbi:hypothetical protein Tco_1139550 [Tanacetum coccineum]
MANLSEDIQSAGFDTRPPMLDRSNFESWQQRIRLYCPERDRVVKDLTPDEKERFKADIHAMNILLQGLPKDIYTFINHYTDAKDIWDNVKMLLEGSELTKDERESQLYDDFKHFHQNKGEIIHEYYVRFVTAVKLNRGLKTSNYDQLYAYLKQHEAHANENKMMLERYTQHAIDPFAFVSNISPQQYLTQSSAIPQSLYVPPVTYQPQSTDNTQLDSRFTSTDDLIENLTKTFKMAGLLFRMFRVDKTEVRGTMQGEQLQLEIEDFRTELAMQILNSEYFKDKMLLMQAQENGVVLDEEQLLFIAGGHTNTFNDDVDEAPVQDLALNEDVFQADLSNPIYDEAGPSYDSDILSEYVKNNTKQVVQSNVSFVPNDALMMIINDMHDQAAQCVFANEQNKVVNELLTAELARYKERVAIYEKGQVKTNHAPAVVHDSEDTLEIAEITRKKMLEKMKSPLGMKFDKTCKKRITPCGLTEGERGFEQTKECYLTEVIPFFKMLKEHFEGIQTALVKEVKEMKEIFKQMEAEVEQNVVDKQCADIKRKNLLIENENLIADCLSNELLYSVMNDVNIVSRFSELHDAYTVEQARCLELEAGIKKSQTTQDTPEFDLFFEINKMKEQLQGKNNTIRKLKEQISHINERRSEADHILDFKALYSQNIKLTEHITRAKTIEKTSYLLTEIEKLKAQLKGKMECVTMNTVKPKVLAPGMYAIDFEPILPRNRNNREVHLDYLKHLKESVETLCGIVEEARTEKSLDNALENAFFYTKRS